MKSEVVHARVNAKIKADAEEILKIIGVSLSQAIDLFLRQIVLKKSLPFKLDISNNKNDNTEKLSYLINIVDGKAPPLKSKKIIHLYANGDIDFETAKFALLRTYGK